MRRILLTILLICLFRPAIAQGINYYVSAQGNDHNSGRSPATPFKTIDHLNKLHFYPGDVIHFKRGDVFCGQLDIRQSGTINHTIKIQAYGTGVAPQISGSIPVKKWTQQSAYIWEAVCPQCGDQVTGLYVDNKALPLGRYPNITDADKGYLKIKSHVGKTQITGNRDTTVDWTGAEVVYKPQMWLIDRAEIIHQAGNTFTITGGKDEIKDGWGYFIQNHPAALDLPGEWCYNRKDKKISFYIDQDPNQENITATVYSAGIRLKDCAYIDIQDIAITQTLHAGILGDHVSNLLIENVQITNSGEDGVDIKGLGHHITMTNNQIRDANNNGVDIRNCSDLVFKDNRLKNIALNPGRGKSGDEQYFAFQYQSTKGDALIEGNTLDSLGYVGIMFMTNNILIRHNVISNYDLVKNDGGGIYTYNGSANHADRHNQKVISNIVFNASGAMEGTGREYEAAYGIYLDDCSSDVTVSNNAVFNCRAGGIYLHGTTACQVDGNTSFNNGVQLLIEDSNGCANTGSNISNNIFFNADSSQVVAKFQTKKADVKDFGVFSTNYYGDPFHDTAAVSLKWDAEDFHEISLPSWQTRLGMDTSSQNILLNREQHKELSDLVSQEKPDEAVLFKYNSTGSPVSYPLKEKYRDVYGHLFTGTVSVLPYSAVLLIRVENR